MEIDLKIQQESLKNLRANFPHALIRDETQKLSEQDFIIQKHKHLSRQARGGAIGIILTPENKIVLTKRKKLHAGWALPGGTVEKNESFDQAYAREIFEEIGVHIFQSSLIMIEKKRFISPDHQELRYVLALFTSRIKQSVLPERTAGAKQEGLKAELFDSSCLPENMILQDRHKILDYLRPHAA